MENIQGLRSESVSEHTAQVLRAGVAKVKAHAAQFNMSFFIKLPGVTYNQLDVAALRHLDGECGSTGCLASWMLMTAPVAFLDNRRLDSIVETAQEYAMLTYTQAENLFYTQFWPVEFASRYNLSTDNEERAQALSDRVEHFIQSGE